MKLYNLGKFEGVSSFYGYVTDSHVRLSCKCNRDFINYIYKHLGANGACTYNYNGEKFIEFSRIDAETREVWRIFELSQLKSLFEAYKKSKLPVQDSLFDIA